MPSQKILEQKQQTVSALRERVGRSVAGVVVDYKGISVINDTKLRRDLRNAGVEYSVVKNTLLKIALKDSGLSDISGVLEGTTALATSDGDLVAAAKLLNKYATDSRGAFKIKAGYVEGKVLDEAGVVALAKLPSKEILLSTVLGTMIAPVAAFARVIQAIADQKGGGEAPAAKADEAPAVEAETAPAETAPAETVAEAAAPVEAPAEAEAAAEPAPAEETSAAE